MIAPVILTCADPSLIEAVTGIIQSIAHLELKVLPQRENTLTQLSRERASLFLIHLRDGTDIGPVSRLLQKMVTTRRATATVVMSDCHHVEQELILLRRKPPITSAGRWTWDA